MAALATTTITLVTQEETIKEAKFKAIESMPSFLILKRRKDNWSNIIFEPNINYLCFKIRHKYDILLVPCKLKKSKGDFKKLRKNPWLNLCIGIIWRYIKIKKPYQKNRVMLKVIEEIENCSLLSILYQ